MSQAGSPAGESRLRRTFSALRNRDFRLVWSGAFISTTGTWMQALAQAWLVLELTGSAFYLGLDAFLATLPMILFSLHGGAVADRIERRRILIASQILQMSIALVLAALVFTGAVRVWHVFIFSFLTGTVQAFGGPAYQALLPLLVKREEVPNAVAMNSLQFNLARMIGPVFAGITLAGWGAAACFTINGLSFLAPLVTLLAIRTKVIPSPAIGRSMLADIREGLAFLRGHAVIGRLTGIAFFATFFGIPLVTLLPVVSKTVFQMGSSGYSMLMTAQGIGSVVGAFLVAGSNVQRGTGRIAIWSMLLFSGALAIFAASHWLPLSLAAVFLAGLSLLGVVTTVSSLVQLATPEAMRGRVMSIFMLAFRGAMPLGNLTAGWVAERWGVTMALGINAAMLAAFGLMFLFRSRDRARRELTIED